MDPLNEREFELINIVGGDLGANQRDLSRQMEISLGMTNLLIKRLISKGYIRIRQLDKRKVEYLLTPKGFAEKMRKSVKYTLKTIHSITSIKENLKNIIRPLYEAGNREFVILGKSDFAHLIERVFEDLKCNDCRILYTESVSEVAKKGILLVAKEDGNSKDWDQSQVVDLIRELAKIHHLTYSRE